MGGFRCPTCGKKLREDDARGYHLEQERTRNELKEVKNALLNLVHVLDNPSSILTRSDILDRARQVLNKQGAPSTDLNRQRP